MKNTRRNIICALVLSTLCAAILPACREDAPVPVPGDNSGARCGDEGIFFTFYAAVASALSRADVTDATDAVVRDLRIVIVSHPIGASAAEGWTVEHNFATDGSAEVAIPAEYTFKVEPGAEKKVYLLANTGGLADASGTALDFSDAAFIPSAGTGRAAVDDYVFAISDGGYSYDVATHGIPMSAVYTEQIPVVDNLFGGDYKASRIYYLVRAATKFSFTFSNESAHKTVELTGYGLESVTTDRMYLYAHTSEGIITGAMADSLATTGTADYELPAGASSVAISRTFDTPISLAAKTGATVATQSVLNAIYLPECRNIKAADSTDSTAQQSYTLTLQASESIYGKAATQQQYSLELPEVTSLFRNTHVWITVTFNDYQLDWQAVVAPYDAVDLNPEFGL